MWRPPPAAAVPAARGAAYAMVNCRGSDQFKTFSGPNNRKSGTGRSPTQRRRPTPDWSLL